MDLTLGTFFLMTGVAIAVVFSGIGSSKGLGIAGQAASGAISEDPNLFGKVLVMQALPMTQSVYGLVVGLLMLFNFASKALTPAQGLAIMACAMPVGFIGMVSGIWQGKVAAAGIQMAVRQPDHSAKGVILAVMVETCAIFSFLASLLGVMYVPIG